MRIKTFSFWEVMISGVIILVLSFVLIGSIVILFRTNTNLSILEEQENCRNSLERFVTSEFHQGEKVYGVDLDGESIVIRKVDNFSGEFEGVAFLKNDEIKLFVKQSFRDKQTYMYHLYAVSSDLNFSEMKNIKDIAKLTSSQDILTAKCSSTSDKTNPFSIQIIEKYNSREKAIILSIEDTVASLRSKKSSARLFLREISEFN